MNDIVSDNPHICRGIQSASSTNASFMMPMGSAVNHTFFERRLV